MALTIFMKSPPHLASPEAPGSTWPRDLDHIASRIVRHHAAAPCAVVAAAARSTRSALDEHGLAIAVGVDGSLSPGEPDATLHTVFDLASVTKPVTALAAARLARQGALSLADPLGRHLPEARGTPSEHVPIELLLAHRAGLDAHRTLFAPLLEGKPVDRAHALREAALARREGCEGAPPPEGFAPIYSDLGYLLVGEALANAAGAPLESVVEREVASPSGARLVPASGLAEHERALVAPTEHAPFRGGVVRAAVHDENAWAVTGLGLAGHAGLFASAPDLLLLGITLLDALSGARPEWLTEAELAPLVRPRPGGTLRAGFDSKSSEGSSAGSRFGPRSIGHLGFTGTSLWLDPDRGLCAVVLTNRVHPTRASDAIRRARPDAHDAIWAWAESR